MYVVLCVEIEWLGLECKKYVLIYVVWVSSNFCVKNWIKMMFVIVKFFVNLVR